MLVHKNDYLFRLNPVQQQNEVLATVNSHLVTSPFHNQGKWSIHNQSYTYFVTLRKVFDQFDIFHCC